MLCAQNITCPPNAELCSSAPNKMRAERAFHTALPAAALCYVRKSGEWALADPSSHRGRWRPPRPGTPWRMRPADTCRPCSRPTLPPFPNTTSSTHAPISQLWLVADAT